MAFCTGSPHLEQPCCAMAPVTRSSYWRFSWAVACFPVGGGKFVCVDRCVPAAGRFSRKEKMSTVNELDAVRNFDRAGASRLRAMLESCTARFSSEKALEKGGKGAELGSEFGSATRLTPPARSHSPRTPYPVRFHSKSSAMPSCILKMPYLTPALHALVDPAN